MSRMSARLSLLLAASLAVASPARAGGTLTGIVRVERAPAKAAPLAVVKDASVCGKEVPDEAVVVSAHRGLANVVVSIRGLKPPQAPAPAPTTAPTKAPTTAPTTASTTNASVDQLGCRYRPHVQAVPLGTRLALVNSDAVLHNVHASLEEGSRSVTVFNLAMPFKGQTLPAVLKRTGIMKLRCDAGHTWMSAYVAVFDHPYFAVTDGQGRFTIRDLPPGEHTLELWHEPVGQQGGAGTPVVTTAVVRISDGNVTTVEPTLEL